MLKNFLATKLHGFHQAHFSILRGAFWVFLFVLIGKASGAVKEVAIAAHYGADAVVDAYVFAFSILTWPSSVWFSVLTIVMVPLVAQLREDTGSKMQEVQSALLGTTLLLGCVFAALAWLILPFVFTSLVVLPVPAMMLTLQMTSFLIPLLPLGFAISFFSVWLMAIGRFSNTLLEGVPALAIAATILLAWRTDSWALIWGTLFGFVLLLSALLVHLGRLGELAWPRWFSISPTYPQFWRMVGILAVGQIAMGTAPIVDQAMAAHLGTGAIATLGYANRVLALVLSLSALVITRATLPVFSSLRAVRDPTLSKLTRQWAFALFLLGALGALGSWWFGLWAVRVLFERGAFTAEDTQAVANVFRYGTLQLPLYCAGMVLVSQLAASGRYIEISVMSLVNLLIKIVANWLLIPGLGLVGIPIATAIMYCGSLVMLVAVEAATARQSRVLTGRNRSVTR